MFVLFLNDMRCHTEHNAPVARAETEEELHTFLESQMVEPYVDEDSSAFHSGGHQYHKCFRKGGPLEWFNSFEASYSGGIKDIGTLEDRLEQTRLWWEDEVMSIPAPVIA